MAHNTDEGIGIRIHPRLRGLKDVYDLLDDVERAELIVELERNLKDLLFRVDEKKALIEYLKKGKVNRV